MTSRILGGAVRICGRRGAATGLLAIFAVAAHHAHATLGKSQPTPFDRPLLFEPNVGQTDAQVRWVARGRGYQLYFTGDSLTMALRNRASHPAVSPREPISPAMRHFPDASDAPPSVVQMRLKGSHPWEAAEGLERSESVSNYLIGKDRKGWHTNVPNYARLKESEVYDGIDMIFYSHGGDLEYDFEVAPGADPNQIRMSFEGADRIRVDKATGDLLMTVSSGAELRQSRPRIYQQIGTRRVEVAGRYEILDQNQVGFTLASYDRSRVLVIDPAVAFTVFFMGETWDYANGIALDSAHNAYITGATSSLHFPLVTGFPSRGLGSYHGGGDAYIAKVSPAGTILFSTYLGGSASDSASAIAVDAGGPYVTGFTASPDFPVFGFSNGTPPRGGDIFVTKIIPMGNDIIYSVVFGGNGEDYPYALAVDQLGAAYITGHTSSRDFPVVGPRPSHFQGDSGYNGFLTKIAPFGVQLDYSGYFGGTSTVGWAIAVDPNGSAYFAGTTQDRNLPVTFGMQGYTPSPYSGPPAYSGYLGKLDPTGGTFQFLRYIGGGIGDSVSSITQDPSGSLFVAGNTYSFNFPTTPLALIHAKPNPAGHGTGFVMRITSTGFTSWSTFFGSTEAAETQLTSVTVGPAGDVYFGGNTSSSNIPGAPTPLKPAPTAGFVTKLDPAGRTIAFTTRLGASVNGVAAAEYVSGFLPFSTIKVYTTGIRFTDGPTDSSDVFVVKLDEGFTLPSAPIGTFQ